MLRSPDFSAVEPYGVSRESFDRLVLYYDLLLKWQKAINLVSPKSLPNAWQRHFIDSAQLLPLLPQDEGLEIVDCGSGGGFAGLVLALCRPDIQVHLIDSDMRKCQFLRTVSRESGASNVSVHNARVEEALPRVKPDLITARGFAALSVILGLAWDAYGAADGMPDMLLLKGAAYEAELADAGKNYSFTCDTLPSATDPTARVLRIKNVCKS